MDGTCPPPHVGSDLVKHSLAVPILSTAASGLRMVHSLCSWGGVADPMLRGTIHLMQKEPVGTLLRRGLWAWRMPRAVRGEVSKVNA